MFDNDRKKERKAQNLRSFFGSCATLQQKIYRKVKILKIIINFKIAFLFEVKCVENLK